MKKILVCIPTYNERESLPRLFPRVRKSVPDAHILVIDDGSPDGTGEWADEEASRDGQVHVMHREGKQGLGTAYLQGFAWGVEQGFDVMCEMDADGQHKPEQLPRLLHAIDKGADLAIGSRWVPGGSVENWSKSREYLSRGGNLYIKIMMQLPVKDATAGFRAYRATLLGKMDLDAVESHGYSFQTDMTRLVVEAGGTIMEVPINFVERQVGQSKISGNIFWESLGRVTRWGVKKRGEQIAKLFRVGNPKS